MNSPFVICAFTNCDSFKLCYRKAVTIYLLERLIISLFFPLLGNNSNLKLVNLKTLRDVSLLSLHEALNINSCKKIHLQLGIDIPSSWVSVFPSKKLD